METVNMCCQTVKAMGAGYFQKVQETDFGKENRLPVQAPMLKHLSLDITVTPSITRR